MQVGLAVSVERQPTKVRLDLGERTINVDARIVGVIALPDRDRAAPVPIAGDRPVTGIADPLAELAVLDVVGDPVDVLVEFGHPVAEFGYLHEPAGNGLIDERIAATPAVRIAVLVARHSEQPAVGPKHLSQWLIGIEDVLAGDLGDDREELTALIHRDDDRDASFASDDLVILTVGRSLVNDTGALAGGDILGDQDLPGVLGPPQLGVRVVIPQTRVGHAIKLCPKDATADCDCCLGSRLIAKLLEVCADRVGGEKVLAEAGFGLGC